MNGSLNPLENPGDTFGNEGPLGDPLLDAFERSIENPPGFTDPLGESDEPLMDDLARQLDAVEASIEKSAQIIPEPDIVDGNMPHVPPGDKFDNSCGTLPEDDSESYEDVEELEKGSDDPQSLIFQSQFTIVASPDQSTLTPHLRDTGSGTRHGEGLLFKQHISRASTGTKGGGSGRVCPDSNELIDVPQCESCEKYRYWPDGTDEEPRECWYDWQARSQHDSSDSEE